MKNPAPTKTGAEKSKAASEKFLQTPSQGGEQKNHSPLGSDSERWVNSAKRIPIRVDATIDRNLVQAGRVLRACIKLEDLDATSQKRLLKPHYSLKEVGEVEGILDDAKWSAIPFLVAKSANGLKPSQIGVGTHSDMVHIILIGGAHAFLKCNSAAPSGVKELAETISTCASAKLSWPKLDEALIWEPQQALAKLFQRLLDKDAAITGKLFDKLLGPVEEGNLSDFYRPAQDQGHQTGEKVVPNSKFPAQITPTISKQLGDKSTRSIATSQLARDWREQVANFRQNLRRYPAKLRQLPSPVNQVPE